MTEAEIKAMQEENATLKTQVSGLTTKVTEFEGQIAEKDKIIKQKTDDIVGARKKYQKLSDLPKEEVEAMTEAERKAKEDQDILAEQQEVIAKQQAEDRQKDIESRKSEAVRKLVGDNKELADKILSNYGKLKDSDSAFSPEEVGRYMNDAFNLLGQDRPDPIRSVVNGMGGGEAPKEGQGTFAETPQGTQLGNLLSLTSTQAAPEAGK